VKFLEPSEVEEFQEALLSWAEAGNLRDFPWREDANPFQVLVAEILLQQTLASKVIPVYNTLMNKYQSPDRLAAAEVDTLSEELEPLGFHNQRARALIENSKSISERGLPETIGELKDLSYVGDYAANATLCFGLGESRPIVDTNVERVYGRIFDEEIDAQNSRSWEFAEEMLPDEEAAKFNLALLDFAAGTCTPSSPSCERCPVRAQCTYYKTQRSKDA